MSPSPGRFDRLEANRARRLAGSTVDGEFVAEEMLADAVVLGTADGRVVAVLRTAGERPFGAAALWAWSHDAVELHLLVEDAGPDAGDQARRRDELAVPGSVRMFTGDEVSPPVESRPLPPPAELVEAAETLRPRLSGLGVDLVGDGDEIVIEASGLEIGRVVTDGDGARLEVGVGAVDREANRVLHGEESPWEALDRVLADVRSERTAGGSAHPLSTMARERWLDRSMRDDPASAGARILVPLAATTPRTGMRVSGPAASMAEGDNGRTLLVSTIGADITLPAVVADHLARDRPDRVQVVVPRGRVLPVVHDLSGRFRVPVAVIEADPPWADDPTRL